MEVSEIRESIKELEKSRDADLTLEVLKNLEKNIKPTEPLLRETKLGVAVNKLRSHSDSRVSELVKRMIARWKETIQAQKHAQARAKALKPAHTTNASKATPEVEPHGAGTKPSSGPRNAKSDGVNTAIYDDKVRNSCVDLIYNAIAMDSSDPSSRLLKIAKDIEVCVFAAEKGTSAAYRTKMRSLYMNLKDPKNPTLRSRVVSGAISTERLRTMSPQEMASAELRKEIEAIEKQNLFNAQGATEKRSVTDRFTCGKCKQKKVSYYQMQTRSADEPLTTFCTCEECGNRWKFS